VLKKLKTLLGVVAGILIVFSFAGAIQGANLWFSQALFERDAKEAATRLARDLQSHLKSVGGGQQDDRLSPADDARPAGLRTSLDLWEVRNSHARTRQEIQRDLQRDVDDFIAHLDSHGMERALATVWFVPTAADAAPHSVAQQILPVGDAPLPPGMEARLAAPLREVLASGQPAFTAPTPFEHRTDTSLTALIALPLASQTQVMGALVVAHDLSTTGIFLNDFVNFGVAIVVVLCGVAMFVAAFFVWMRFRDRLQASQTIQFLAHHDALTGLPNRTVFSTKLNEALRLANAKATSIAVMLIDVDKFKQINDTHGHAVGDLFLQVIADRLRSVFGDHLVSRLSGDEFAVLITSVTERREVTRLAATMIEATRAPTRIDGKDLQISLSIGIAQAREAAWRSSRILHCADLALYRSKHSGRSTFKWYSPDMDEEAQRRKELEEDLRKALANDEFRLLYQPQFSLGDLQLTGYETLLRWEHPEKGTISPTVFIPIAEDCGLIEEIGSWVLHRACREAAAWENPALTVAVNVSPAQFRPGKTEERVAHALKTSGLDPHRLEIEITESLLIADTDAVVKTLTHVRQMGVSVAMDDFGTGYSSLSYLSRFPFDTIKIDRAFVATLGKNRTTDAIVASIVGLGRSLGVTITAEGVENDEQVTLLRAAGCDKVQGFLFGKPMDLSDGRTGDLVDGKPQPEHDARATRVA